MLLFHQILAQGVLLLLFGLLIVAMTLMTLEEFEMGRRLAGCVAAFATLLVVCFLIAFSIMVWTNQTTIF